MYPLMQACKKNVCSDWRVLYRSDHCTIIAFIKYIHTNTNIDIHICTWLYIALNNMSGGGGGSEEITMHFALYNSIVVIAVFIYLFIYMYMYILIARIIVLFKSLFSVYIPKIIFSEFIYWYKSISGSNQSAKEYHNSRTAGQRWRGAPRWIPCSMSSWIIGNFSHDGSSFILYLYVARCLWEESCALFYTEKL